MQSNTIVTEFDRSAAGIYLKALERLLGISQIPQELGRISKTALPGGCVLYAVPPRQWRRIPR